MTARQQQAVIFLHLPKTAGTTLNRIARRHYAPEAVHALGPRAQDEIAAFQALGKRERERVRFLTGHMAFGLHEDLPAPSRYITLLRHPVERVISFFYYIRHMGQHYLHDLVVREHDMDLEAYLDSELSVMVDNG